jgi:WD40 repeat protein
MMGPGVSRGGARMASAHGRVVRVWEGPPSEVLASTAEHGTQITSMALNGDGSRLVTGTADGQVRVWSVGDPAPLMAFTAHKGSVNAVAIDPGDRLSSREEPSARFACGIHVPGGSWAHWKAIRAR